MKPSAGAERWDLTPHAADRRPPRKNREASPSDSRIREPLGDAFFCPYQIGSQNGAANNGDRRRPRLAHPLGFTDSRSSCRRILNVLYAG